MEYFRNNFKKKRELKKKIKSKDKGVEYIKELNYFTEELKLINEKILKINHNFTLNFKKPKTNKAQTKKLVSKKIKREIKNKSKVIASHNIASSLNKIEKSGGINKQARMVLNYKKRKNNPLKLWRNNGIRVCGQSISRYRNNIKIKHILKFA